MFLFYVLFKVFVFLFLLAPPQRYLIIKLKIIIIFEIIATEGRCCVNVLPFRGLYVRPSVRSSVRPHDLFDSITPNDMLDCRTQIIPGGLDMLAGKQIGAFGSSWRRIWMDLEEDFNRS